MNIPAPPNHDLPVEPNTSLSATAAEVPELESDAIRPTPAGSSSTNQTGEFEGLPINALWGFRVGQCALAFVLWIPVVIISLAVLTPLFGGKTGATVSIGMLALLLLWAWKLAKRRYLAVRFLLDSAGLTICRGVYWQSETHIARSRVQHTDIQRGPLDRRLGLADLLVHTAGTSMATVRLSGLSVERAQSLRDALLEGHDQRF